MSREPDFDELTADAEPGERERLRRVHDMLVVAGPPPELTPQMEAGPTLGMTIGGRRSRRHMQRRVALLAAAIVVLLLAFLVGYISGNDSKVSGRLLKLQGTAAAPDAQASLRLEDVDPAGNWPMELAALGLPKLPPKGYYEVFLVRNGKPWAPCGTFVVKNAKVGVSVQLNAPYRLRRTDSWIVTRQTWGDRGAGPVVLEPLT
ncbi:MAG: hypothetical protein ABI990_05910 [Actinomycetota bacterium]